MAEAGPLLAFPTRLGATVRTVESRSRNPQPNHSTGIVYSFDGTTEGANE